MINKRGETFKAGTLAEPKSQSLSWCVCVLTSRFCGLMSRWHTPMPWMCASARHICARAHGRMSKKIILLSARLNTSPASLQHAYHHEDFWPFTESHALCDIFPVPVRV